MTPNRISALFIFGGEKSIYMYVCMTRKSERTKPSVKKHHLASDFPRRAKSSFSSFCLRVERADAFSSGVHAVSVRARTVYNNNNPLDIF